MYALFAPLGTVSLSLLGVSLNSSEAKLVIFGGLFPLNTTLVKRLQPLKADDPMLVTELGILTLVKRLQP